MPRAARRSPRPTTTHLSSIYKSLGSQLGTETHHHDISSGFAIAGLALLLGAGVGTLALGGRLP